MHERTKFSRIFSFTLLAVAAANASAQEAPDPYAVADEVSRMWYDESTGKGPPSASRADDDTLIQRAFLDLIGRPPTREEVLSYRDDTGPHKHRELVQRLLANPDYGTNWGRYWRDVIMYHRSEDRALLCDGHYLADFLGREFNRNRPWSHTVKLMISASGFTDDFGQAAFITAQGGLPENIAGEASRVFLGVQIECAQCHDHPNGTWKREQFHHFAAFFSRVGAQLHREKVVFQVTVTNREIPVGDGKPRFFGNPEHYMPDLRNPASKGTLMEPAYFLTGQRLPQGSSDDARRRTLADWIVARDNPQFSKAFVNRIWSELVGMAFCQPVDDLGPQSKFTMPRTFDYLSHQFIESGYDVKWLFSTIMATEVYGQGNVADSSDETRTVVANCAQPVRAEQLLNSLISAFDLKDDIQDPPAAAPPIERGTHVRYMFNKVFGYDPSKPREDVVPTIPQSLLLINSSFINDGISTQRSKALGGILARNSDNKSAVTELYLRTLGRHPTDSEAKTCLDHIGNVELRNEAFEDIFWALINSTEFSYRW